MVQHPAVKLEIAVDISRLNKRVLYDLVGLNSILLAFANKSIDVKHSAKSIQ